MKKNIFKVTLICVLAVFSLESDAIENPMNKIKINEISATTEVFKVFGNCGMCKTTIESSLKNEKGIQSAIWDKETKMIEVTYDESKITLDEIKKKIAASGYDTEEFKAPDSAYNNLANCCTP